MTAGFAMGRQKCHLIENYHNRLVALEIYSEKKKIMVK